MDADHFDDFARTLATSTSRRRVLASLAAGAAGVFLGLLPRPGRADTRVARAPALQGAGSICTSAAATAAVQARLAPAAATITARSDNVVTGSCDDYNRFVSRSGAAKADGSRNPGSLGVSDIDFAINPKVQTTTRQQSADRWCATVTLSYPASLDIGVTAKVFAVEWQSKECLSPSCRAEWERLLVQIKAHEARHLQDAQVVLKAGRSRWARPRRFEACAATEQESLEALNKQIGAAIGAENTTMSTEYDACEKAFHATPAGAPGSLDCTKCQANKPVCGVACCQEGLVCSSSVAGGAPPGRGVAQPREECVCPDGRPPCGSGGACCEGNETCRDGVCEPAVCRAGGSCNNTPECAPGCGCMTTTEGTGACVPNPLCKDVPVCLVSANCPPGSECITANCCEDGLPRCAPICTGQGTSSVPAAWPARSSGGGRLATGGGGITAFPAASGST